jgi:chemotaxis protein CheY-P-specific phosphatase CheC/ActR/RegA family two-component response regulator
VATKILVCDDSSFARKQMARALPKEWDAELSFANDGVEGLRAIRGGKGEVIFLDLNMPELDGYGVLQTMREEGLPGKVIVVSGDIQPEAHNRVTGLGALAFIKKPAAPEDVLETLVRVGLWRGAATESHLEAGEIDVRDGCREITNVAMGRAADLLARLLGVFVVLPVPRVDMLEGGDLRMTLENIAHSDSVAGVCQGFIGGNIAGEALLIFHESSYTDLAELLKHEGELDQSVELELLLDMASILIGACLKGLADQLDISFSQGHPLVLGRHTKISNLVRQNAAHWTNILTIEMGFEIENRNVGCDLLLMFTEDSLATLEERLSYALG